MLGEPVQREGLLVVLGSLGVHYYAIGLAAHGETNGIVRSLKLKTGGEIGSEVRWAVGNVETSARSDRDR